MVTECSMSDNVASAYPDVKFVRPCNLCPHMKRIDLAKVHRSLERLEHKVDVPPEVAEGARRALERMLQVGKGEKRPGSGATALTGSRPEVGVRFIEPEHGCPGRLRAR